MASAKKSKSGGKKDNENDLLDMFHPEVKLCTICKTSQQTKPNVFASFRPESGACVDYDISQTDAKLDGKGTKIHIQQTKARYNNLVEPDEFPNQKEMKSEKTCFCADKLPEVLNLGSPQLQPLPAPEESKFPKLMFIEPKTDKKTLKKHKKDENREILDVFHPEGQICSIWKTTATEKPNIFATFRPEVGAVLDYTISQTDAKLDAGPTKIHYQQTEAQYDWASDYDSHSPVHKPRTVRKKKIILNIEDIERMRNDEMEALFVIYRQELKYRLKFQKKIDKLLLALGHEEALRRVGPTWFQELSPNQIKTVNNLKKAICRDLQTNTYENSYENIKNLGVYLRPNHRYIQLALRECCKCPVEFLLILYQVIDPKRKKYSINDRLLLSAATHLTMTDTLRELHVRIPSPPRLVETAAQIKVKQKKIKYESPYLEPFTFEPEPRKWNGVYRNKHVQRPESPYFAYLEKFREDLANAADVSKAEDSSAVTEDEKEILDEWKKAQKVYESLVEFRPVPKLLKPSIFVPCVNFRLKKEQMLAEKKLQEVIDKIEAPPAPDLGAVFDKLCRHCQKVYKGKIKEMEGNLDEQTQTCTEETCHDDTEDSCDTSSLPEAVEDTCDAQDSQEAPCSEVNASENVCDSGGQQAGENACETCDAEVAETAPEVKEETVKRSVSTTKQQVKDKKPVSTTKQQVKDGDVEVCDCKLEVNKLIDLPQCSCERCTEDRKKKNPMIIAGLSEPPVDEGILRVIEGVYSPECSCLKRYEDAIQRYEDYQAKMKAIRALRKLEHKYVINGVVNTPDGPVFNIIGLRPQIDCICAKNQRREAEENARLAGMPKAPPGRIKFGIIGTKETDAGNVYVLSSALPIDDCDCMKLCNKYEDKHATCLKLWENYLKQMQGNVDEYMEDMGIDIREIESTNKEAVDEDVVSRITDESLFGRKRCKCGACIIKKPPCGGPLPCMPFPCPPSPCIPPPCALHSCPPDSCQPFWPCIPSCPPIPCGCRKPVDCTTCDCGDQEVTEVVCEDCTCAPPPEPEPEPESIKQPGFKRFFILDKISCCRRIFMTSLKQALESMAGDNYPLAKLPDVHRLPHFKLWMQMRCGKFWTQEEKYRSVQKSKLMWKHIEVCKRPIRAPELGMSKDVIARLKWTQAAAVKTRLKKIKYDYTRKVRQDMVNFGREFFPTLFDYEFPTSTFRDCYFAYTPTKEEEVLSMFVWDLFEVKNFSGRQSCFC